MPNPPEWPKPSVTVDAVVVDRADGHARVLLIRRRNPPFQGSWALPGGFVEPFEPLEKAARRELEEEARLRPQNMDQMRAFGDPGRDPRGWTISVVFLALLSPEEAQAARPQAGDDAREIGWFDLEALPPLAFDHAEILAYARDRLSRWVR